MKETEKAVRSEKTVRSEEAVKSEKAVRSERAAEAEKTGTVTLVGAGCGRGLITVKGLLALKKADVVVYDDLIDTNLLLETKADCEKIYVGKRTGKHSRAQQEINELLVQKAGEGRQVVRLKGGDGFIFGRGGEEILYLSENQIPCEVIPGVTSASAVPGHAGIPVTHRGMAQSVAIVTGHSASGREENYQALAALEGTLVFLMGLGRIGEITEKLIRNGKAPETPASIISGGYTACEKRIDGTLLDIAQKARQAQTPAVLVVGKTAALSLESRIPGALEEVSVTVTGTESFVKKVCGRLSELGADVDCRPCLRIVPEPEQIPDSFGDIDWVVFTSANGVELFFEALFRRKTDLRSLSAVKFASIGPGTSDRLAGYGIYADIQPKRYTAERLGEELAAVIKPGERVMIFRAREGTADLTETLKSGGISFTDVPLYHTEPVCERIQGFCAKTDYIVFGSARGAETFLENGDFSFGTVPVCIGPVTERALREIRRKKDTDLAVGNRAARGTDSVSRGKAADEADAVFGGRAADETDTVSGGGMREEACLVPEEYTVEGIAASIIENVRKKEGGLR